MNTPLTPGELEREWQRQARAEQRERTNSREHDDPSTDRYRLIHRLLKQDDMPALPVGFAARMARQVQDFEERAQFETSALRITLIIAVIAGLFFVVPPLVEAIGKISASISLPWPMLYATLFALAFAVVIDRASSRYRTS